ncbi:type II secretion system protein GspC [Polyangium sp. 6x1]|uniref:type II secretion system protein GspC n=1 Tax=Polyangium sp. 6x1 TaxID=3042689 RepID=UPI002482FC58|nr:type II secretion system protein GspC [Polyangium sp. 6x1]MDI1442859.1 type II secretion system protein GspC [Polyangium sp. 6x1]
MFPLFMGFDARSKKWFPAVLVLLVGLAAYFQAAGLGRLVASSLTGPPFEPLSPRPQTKVRNALAAVQDGKNGGAILGRNPFDSITGPLARQGPPDDGDPKPPEPLGDPYADPICDAAKVLLITEADDALWSFAAIAGPDGRASLRRLGDDIGGRTVHAMAWDRVWLRQGEARCQLPLHERREGPVARKKPGDAPSKPASGARVPPELADRIRKDADNHYVVDRSVIDTILERPDLLGAARLAPAREGDTVVGMRVSGIRPGSLPSLLGLQNGDRLDSINGFETRDLTKMVEAFARLKAADRLDVRIVRGGKPTSIEVEMR